MKWEKELLGKDLFNMSNNIHLTTTITHLCFQILYIYFSFLINFDIFKKVVAECFDPSLVGSTASIKGFLNYQTDSPSSRSKIYDNKNWNRKTVSHSFQKANDVPWSTIHGTLSNGSETPTEWKSVTDPGGYMVDP